MRVTTEKKEQTRLRILECARNLFQEKGFYQTTTRDIAIQAEIAAGTLFNYFPSKEALGLMILVEAFDQARDEVDRAGCGATVQEGLFIHVAAILRNLHPHRRYVGEILETALSPFAANVSDGDGGPLRCSHLELARRTIMSHASAGVPAPTVVTMHLYWTLFIGVLAFWSADESPRQEDTLALLDDSMHLFALALPGEPPLMDGAPDAR